MNTNFEQVTNSFNQNDWYSNSQDDYLFSYEYPEQLGYAAFIQALGQIEAFVDEIKETNSPAFIPSNQVSNTGYSDNNALFELKLANHFYELHQWVNTLSPEYNYSPNIRVFFNSFAQLGVKAQCFTHPNHFDHSSGKFAFELFNELISIIRIESQGNLYRRDILKRQYNAARRFNSATEYIDKLFHNHAKLLVLRVDFSYLKKYSQSVSAEEAWGHFAHFLNNYNHNESLNQFKKGYLWKMEYSARKGHHFHVIFFYDGNHVQSDTHWSSLLGDYWRQVTKGKGMYWNCNAEKEIHKKLNQLGIGKIHRNDLEKRYALINNVVRYLSKPEQHLLATRIDTGRRDIFGKGECRMREI